ncbi:uncharacterized protein PV09_04645 [Verruconis gallopava]|uniref:Uncharacterized protein n=1 Tax=Verruconis gallopava TaxID=253628 RepID=A0A0D2AYW9_9PEZI|nr:uncharacterized protein PV09_04645 [Verruconis gallopava]KIW04359.1 hypothetical protein PV09_04645 [Verruconis gallopava]
MQSVSSVARIARAAPVPNPSGSAAHVRRRPFRPRMALDTSTMSLGSSDEDFVKLSAIASSQPVPRLRLRLAKNRLSTCAWLVGLQAGEHSQQLGSFWFYYSTVLHDKHAV